MKYSNVKFWLKGKPIQNFGDYLTFLFQRDLFYPAPLEARSVRLVGSVLDDHVPPLDARWHPVKATPERPVVAWACGVRKPGGLGPDMRKLMRILGVRGPLSVADLKLPASTPQGDPGLLLPYIYQPRPAPRTQGKSICIPHFHETRTDDELLRLSGCEVVVRPNIRKHPRYLYRILDEICAAEFVLTNSLHGAIVSLAYGRPFAYWSNGHLDLPFKWDDFSASVNITNQFANDLAEGRRIYDTGVRSQVKIPPLLPILSVAPFPVRPQPLRNLLLKELGFDSASYSPEEFEASIAKWAATDPAYATMIEVSRKADAAAHNQADISWRTDFEQLTRKALFPFLRAARRAKSGRSAKKHYEAGKTKPVVV